MKRTIFIWVITLTGIFAQGLENLDMVKDRIAEYYENGQFDSEMKQATDPALVILNQLSAEGLDAVVFDVDETALSNYRHIKEVGFGYIPSLWNDWIHEEKATRIEPVYSLYKAAVEKGFRIIFITGRNDSQYTATFNNLIAEGYTKFDTLITKPMKHGYSSASEFKAAKRTALAAKGYRIVLCVGDQISDCDIENYGIRVKLPNYLYFVK